MFRLPPHPSAASAAGVAATGAADRAADALDACPADQQVIHYDSCVHGEVPAFRLHPDFAAFRAQYLATFDAIGDAAAALAPGHQVLAELAQAKRDLFPQGPVGQAAHPRLERDIALLFRCGKPALEQIAACLGDPDIGAGVKGRVLAQLADALPKCSGGWVNGVSRAAHTLQLSRDSTLEGRARALLNEVLSERLLALVLQRHPARQWDTHRYQACLNALSKRFELPAVDDPVLRNDELTHHDRAVLEQIADPFEQTCLHGGMLRRLADEYLDAARTVLGADHRLFAGDMLSVEEVADIAGRLACATPPLSHAFGEVHISMLLRELSDGYRFDPDSALLARQLAANLRQAGFPVAAPVALADWSEGGAKPGDVQRRMSLMQLGRLYWVECASEGHPPRAVEAADLARLRTGLLARGTLDNEDWLATAERTLTCDAAGLGDDGRQALVDGLAAVGATDAEAMEAYPAVLARVRASPAHWLRLQQELAERVVPGWFNAPVARLHAFAMRHDMPALADAMRARQSAQTGKATSSLGGWAGRRHLLAAAGMGDVPRLAELLMGGVQLAPVALAAIDAARERGAYPAMHFLEKSWRAQQWTIAAVRADSLARVQRWIGDTPGPDFEDADGKTPLCHAVAGGHYRIAEWLLGAGASPLHGRPWDSPQESLLTLPFYRRDIAMAGLLLRHACERDPQRAAAALKACMSAAAKAEGETLSALWKLLDAAAEVVGFAVPPVLARNVLMQAVVRGDADGVRRLAQTSVACGLKRERAGAQLLKLSASHADPACAAQLVGALLEAGCRLRDDGGPTSPPGSGAGDVLACEAIEAALEPGREEVFHRLIGHADAPLRLALLSRAGPDRLRRLLDHLNPADLPGELPPIVCDAILSAAHAAMAPGQTDQPPHLVAWLEFEPIVRRYPEWLAAALSRAVRLGDADRLAELLRLRGKERDQPASRLVALDRLRFPQDVLAGQAVVACLWAHREQLDPPALDVLLTNAFKVQPLEWVRQQIDAVPEHGPRALSAMLDSPRAGLDVLALLELPAVRPSRRHLQQALENRRFDIAGEIMRRLGIDDARAIVAAHLGALAARPWDLDNRASLHSVACLWLKHGGEPSLTLESAGETLMQVLIRDATTVDETLVLLLRSTRRADIDALLRDKDSAKAALCAVLKAARRQCPLHAGVAAPRGPQDAVRRIVGHVFAALRDMDEGTAIPVVRLCAADLLALALAQVLGAADASALVALGRYGVTIEGWAGRQLLAEQVQKKNWAGTAALLDAGARWTSTPQANATVAQAIQSGVSPATLERLLSGLRGQFERRNGLFRLLDRLRYGRNAWINRPLSTGETLLDVGDATAGAGSLVQVLRQHGARGRRAGPARLVVDTDGHRGAPGAVPQ